MLYSQNQLQWCLCSYQCMNHPVVYHKVNNLNYCIVQQYYGSVKEFKLEVKTFQKYTAQNNTRHELTQPDKTILLNHKLKALKNKVREEAH
jgi:hypothetical protein